MSLERHQIFYQNLFNFSSTTGWIDRFKVRHNIVCRAVSGESGSVNESTVDEWKEKTLPKLLSGYAPRDVFNADETGLFYKLLPSYSLNVKGDICTGKKKAKDRITFLIACNMDGSEKLKLFVIGKFENPRCFKGVKSLPVIYEANRRAWMTGCLFQKWLLKLDRKFAVQQRKVRCFNLFQSNDTAINLACSF